MKLYYSVCFLDVVVWLKTHLSCKYMHMFCLKNVYGFVDFVFALYYYVLIYELYYLFFFLQNWWNQLHVNLII